MTISTNMNAQTKNTETAVFNVSRLQWSAIELDQKQYTEMYNLAKNVMHLYAAVDQPNFSVFAMSNGSLFELYGPGSPKRPWMNGKNGSGVGFAVNNIDNAIKELKKAGCELIENIQVYAKAGENGADYKYQLFRAADGRIYAIAQTK